MQNNKIKEDVEQIYYNQKSQKRFLTLKSYLQWVIQKTNYKSSNSSIKSKRKQERQYVI